MARCARARYTLTAGAAEVTRWCDTRLAPGGGIGVGMSSYMGCNSSATWRARLVYAYAYGFLAVRFLSSWLFLLFFYSFRCVALILTFSLCVMATSMTKNSDIELNVAPTRSTDKQDDIALARLGKKAVLKRRFGFLSILGFSCTVLITWEGSLV